MITSVALFQSPIAAQSAGQPFTHRIVYDQCGIKGKYYLQLIEHIKIAGPAGYNAIIPCEWGYENLEEQKPEYFDHFKLVVAEAGKYGMQIVPWHFYQQHGAHENINLAEAFPAIGTPFVVSNGTARAYSHPVIRLQNGGFETGKPVPESWKARGFIPTMDSQIKHSGSTSVKYEDLAGYASLSQMVKGLRPFRAYELSVWIRTENFSGGRGVKFQVLDGQRTLLSTREAGFGKWGINGNLRTFRQYKADFNTLEASGVQMRILVTETGATGAIWFDDAAIREVGLYETVRRASCPITVKSADGNVTYVENIDYTVDPKCSAFTEEDYHYEGDLRIPTGSSIKEGQKLQVNWYQLANIDTRIPESDFCLPQTYTTLQDNLNQIDKLFGNSNQMYCNVDEWRVAAWSQSCEVFQFRTGGEYMAKAWAGIECMLRKSGNGCRTIYVWNDMFDPYHNSAKQCGVVYGGTLGSWQGLSHDAVINNWNRSNMEKSLRFFMGLDPKYPNVKNRQVLNVIRPEEMEAWLDNLEKLEKEGGEGVLGITWSNWDGHYTTLETIANICKDRGRWGTGSMPNPTCAPAEKCSTIIVGMANTSQRSAPKQAELSVFGSGNGRISVKYMIPRRTMVGLRILDVRGRCIEALDIGVKKTGQHHLRWDRKALAQGLYIFHLTTDGRHHSAQRCLVF